MTILKQNPCILSTHFVLPFQPHVSTFDQLYFGIAKLAATYEDKIAKSMLPIEPGLDFESWLDSFIGSLWSQSKEMKSNQEQNPIMLHTDFPHTSLTLFGK